jgi:hypothetical protein
MSETLPILPLRDTVVFPETVALARALLDPAPGVRVLDAGDELSARRAA